MSRPRWQLDDRPVFHVKPGEALPPPGVRVLKSRSRAGRSGAAPPVRSERRLRGDGVPLWITVIRDDLVACPVHKTAAPMWVGRRSEGQILRR